MQTELTREVICTIYAFAADNTVLYQGAAPAAACENADLIFTPRPIDRYVGTGAGCTYSIAYEPQPWASTCSNNTYRYEDPVCMLGSQPVDMALCTEWPPAGFFGPMQRVVYGPNYEGCVYELELGGVQLGACTGGERSLSYPDRRCDRLDTDGFRLGSVDMSYCSYTAPGNIACGGSDPRTVPPGSPEHMGCVLARDTPEGADQDSISVNTPANFPNSFYPSREAVIQEVCGSGVVHGTACCRVVDETWDGSPRLSVITYAPGVASGETCMEQEQRWAQGSPSIAIQSCTIDVRENP